MEKGEIVALVGESGSGKTLTTKFILGILPERSIIHYEKFEKKEEYNRNKKQELKSKDKSSKN